MPPPKRHLDSQRVLNARRLRAEPSVAEDIAWKVLRKGRIGFRFRRQHAIDVYVLDFYCPEAKLALEFDGEQHDPVRDARRDALLADKGIFTLRIPNREFFFLDEPSEDWVRTVVRTCEERTGRAAPRPLP